jgi:hypothetical protein
MLSVVVRLLCLMGWLIKLLAWAAATGTCCSIWSSETALVHQLLSNAATVGVLARTPRLRRVLLQVSFVRDIGPPMTYILHQQRGIETLEKMSAMKTTKGPSYDVATGVRFKLTACLCWLAFACALLEPLQRHIWPMQLALGESVDRLEKRKRRWCSHP